MRKVCVPLIAILVLAIGASFAYAGSGGYNAQMFWPSIIPGNFIAIEDSHVLCPLGGSLGLYFNYANGPVETRMDDETYQGVLNELYTANLFGAFGPADFVAIGVDVPIHMYARGRSLDQITNEAVMTGLGSNARIGDVRAELKFAALKQENHWLGMAIAPFGTFPSGDETLFLGEGRVTGGLTVVLEHDFEALNVALNGGYHYRGDYEFNNNNVGSAAKFGAGISREFDVGVSFSIEYFGTYAMSSDQEDFQSDPMELLGTLRYKFGNNLPRIMGGASGGLTSGVGCPAYRTMLGVDWKYCRPEPTDGKLYVEVIDQNENPIKADLDISGPKSDKVATNAKGKWRSPMPPGKYKVTASKPGYISDSKTKTVELGKTTKIILQIKKVPTTLKVLVTDKFSGAKLNATVHFKGEEKKLKWEITNGEREEGFWPGTYKITASAKGYETLFTSVVVEEGKANFKHIKLRKKIEKIGKIFFDFDSDVIRKKSYPVLDDVVKQINQLGTFSKILIQGHCSSEGTDEYNMDLSRRRAISVKNYLIHKSIDGSKLEVEPFGESQPIASNENEEGRSKNRRVEFIIEE